MDDLISRQAAIDTEGLDAEIRCEMCTNPMHTDRGCDGHCEYDEKLYEKIMQVLDERIKPLPSAQPDLQPTCNNLATDTISRQAAIDAALTFLVEYYGAAFDEDMQKMLSERLDTLPSAQPERMKGEWLPQDHNKRTGYVTTTVYYYPKCSECGHTGNYGMNYCPSCGADMRGEQDG